MLGSALRNLQVDVHEDSSFGCRVGRAWRWRFQSAFGLRDSFVRVSNKVITGKLCMNVICVNTIWLFGTARMDGQCWLEMHNLA